MKDINKTKENMLKIVAPAGDLLRFKIACVYGADNVYFSGQKYGLRAAANNLCDEEIKEASEFSKKYGTKMLVTINAIMHDKDLDGIREYIKFLDSNGVYAAIVADPYLVSLIKKNSNLKVHISTQTSCLNSYTAKFWKDLGADRIVLAREISLEEAKKIKEESGLEIEVFVHGSMCMSYSGKCGLSTYLSKRDANRGGCIQACRFSYQSNDNIFNAKHPFSSKDLAGISLIDKFFENDISALKIEGRMKSAFYLATTVKNYKAGIEAYKNKQYDKKLINKLKKNLELIPHRDYFNGSLLKLAGKESVYPDNLATTQNANGEFLGIVLQKTDDFLIVKNYQKLEKNDDIYFLKSDTLDDVKIKLTRFYDARKNKLTSVRQEQVILIPITKKIENIKQYEIIYGKN